MNICPQIKRILYSRTATLLDVYEELRNVLQGDTCQIIWENSQIVIIDEAHFYLPSFNSFAPTITITSTGENSTTYKIVSRLQQSTQVILSAVWIVVAIIEILLIVMSLNNELVFLPILLMPLGLFMFSYMLSIVGLWLFSRRIFKKIELSILTN